MKLSKKALVAYLVAVTAIPALAKPPEIGDPLDAGAKVALMDGKKMDVVADSAQTYPAYRIVRDSIPYLVGFDEKKNAIVYICPDDPQKFKTPEGIQVGTSLNDVTAIAKSSPIRRPGWAYVLRLPSGWNAAFLASPHDPTGAPLDSNSKVDFLFKSNWSR
jgi:hypothetical protein